MRRLFIVWALFTILISGCKHNPVVPPPTKDMRALKWTVDTLTDPGSIQLWMGRMWASSVEDIYIVGYNADPFGPTMFHFDGKAWSAGGFQSSKGGSVDGPVELDDVYGFGPHDVWAVGSRLYGNPNSNGPILDSSFIVHYDGLVWKEYKVFGGRELAAIWGSSPNDIWACGINTVLHYNGSAWTKGTVYLPGESIWLGSVCGSSSNDLFMTGFRYDVSGGMGIENYFLYRHLDNNWVLTDSCTTGNERFGYSLGTVVGTIYSLNRGVWRWEGTTWQQLFANDWKLIGIAGVSEDNLFVCGDGSGLFQYNGVDWYQIPGMASAGIFWEEIWTDGSTVVVLGSDGYKSYVARGE